MNTERYLFRGKRKLNGKWVEGSLIYGENDWTFIVPIGTEIEDYKHDRIRIITDSIGQWAGLTDKNGVKIFEGDIYCVAKNKEYEVKFCNGGESSHEWYGGAFILFLDEETFFPFDEFAIKNGEVIGNIHD